MISFPGMIWRALTLSPGRELPLSERATELCRDNLRKALDQTVLSLKGKAKKELLDRYSPYLELLEEGIWDSGMEQLLTMFYPQAGSLMDYLNDGMVLVSEPDQVNESIKEIKEVRQSRYYDLLEAGRILPSFYDNFLDSEELLQAVRKKRALLFSLLPAGNNSLLFPSVNINIAARQLPLYFNNYQALKDDLNFFKNNQYADHLQCQLKDASFQGGRDCQRIGFPRGQFYTGPDFLRALKAAICRLL